MNQYQAYQVSTSRKLAKSAQHNHQQEHLRYSESIRKNVHNPITSLIIIHSLKKFNTFQYNIYICTYVHKFIHIFHLYIYISNKIQYLCHSFILPEILRLRSSLFGGLDKPQVVLTNRREGWREQNVKIQGFFQ